MNTSFLVEDQIAYGRVPQEEEEEEETAVTVVHCIAGVDVGAGEGMARGSSAQRRRTFAETSLLTTEGMSYVAKWCLKQ
jgi:delta-aminolevulinic acid dehydratase/porphobilinogen synthase